MAQAIIKAPMNKNEVLFKYEDETQPDETTPANGKMTTGSMAVTGIGSNSKIQDKATHNKPQMYRGTYG